MQSGESHQQKGVGSQLWGIHDLLLQVVDLKLEVPDLRSGGIHPNLTPEYSVLFFLTHSVDSPVVVAHYSPPTTAKKSVFPQRFVVSLVGGR